MGNPPTEPLICGLQRSLRSTSHETGSEEDTQRQAQLSQFSHGRGPAHTIQWGAQTLPSSFAFYLKWSVWAFCSHRQRGECPSLPKSSFYKEIKMVRTGPRSHVDSEIRQGCVGILVTAFPIKSALEQFCQGGSSAVLRDARPEAVFQDLLSGLIPSGTACWQEVRY